MIYVVSARPDSLNKQKEIISKDDYKGKIGVKNILLICNE